MPVDPKKNNAKKSTVKKTTSKKVAMTKKPSEYRKKEWTAWDVNKKKDTKLDDVIEIFDPTGISSWDDVKRSYKKTGASAGTAMETAGAIPVIGKFGKFYSGLKTGSNYFKEAKLSKALRVVDKGGKAASVNDVANPPKQTFTRATQNKFQGSKKK